MVLFASIILGVAIIVLSIRFYIVYAKLASHKSFNREARKRATQLKYQDPIISCDYCGTAINTGRYKTCPHCGAAYDQDEEWISRHRIDRDWVEENAEEYADEVVSEAQRKARRTARILKKLIITLACIWVVVFALYFILEFTGLSTDYARTEELNPYSYDNYVEESYHVTDGDVLIDCPYVKVSIIGIYRDEDAVKIGYTLENLTDEPISIALDLAGVNDCSGSGYSSMIYETLKKHDTVTIYGRLFGFPNDVNRLIYANPMVHYKDDYINLFEAEEPIVAVTDAPKAPKTESSGKVLFDDKGVVIRFEEQTEYGAVISIENNTGDSLIATIDKAKIAEKSVDVSGIYKEIIPVDTIYYSSNLRGWDDEGNNYSNEKLDANISFSSSEHPEMDFSTGYIKLY